MHSFSSRCVVVGHGRALGARCGRTTAAVVAVRRTSSALHYTPRHCQRAAGHRQPKRLHPVGGARALTTAAQPSDAGVPPAQERTLALHCGLRVAALEWQPADGGPRGDAAGDSGRSPAPGTRVLALHGWLDNAATFAATAPALAAAGFHVVALDFVGHGRSDHRPRSAYYHQCENIANAVEAVEALGWLGEGQPPFCLLGHSMGAGIASMLTAVLRDAVRCRVLIDALGLYSSDPQRAPQQLLDGVRANQALRDRPRKAYASVEAAADARVRSARGQPISREAALAIARRGTAPADGRDGVCFSHDPRLSAQSLQAFSEAQMVAFVQHHAPALLINAARGWPYPPGYAERREAVAGLEVVDVDGGHHLHLDPDTAPAVTELILRFLLRQLQQPSP